MKREPLNLTEDDGYAALRQHTLARALAARERYGPDFDEASIRRLLQDPEVVRFPTRIEFAAEPLLSGEFGWARPNGERPADGFTLLLHPCFRDRPEVLPELVAYHVVSINYLDIATHVEAELFGAALLGLEIDDYYARICALADSVPGAPGPQVVSLPQPSGCSSCDCGGHG